MKKALKVNAECYDESDYFAEKQEKLDKFFRKIERIGWRIGFRLSRRAIKIIGLSLMVLLAITAGSLYFLKVIAKGTTNQQR